MRAFQATIGALGIAFLTADVASAALQRYHVRHTRLTFGSSGSPTVNFTPVVDDRGEPATGRVLIDEAGAAPVASRFAIESVSSLTVNVPSLSGFIYVRRRYTEGPMDGQSGVSGSTESRIRWGTLTGWDSSGTNWCNSEPASICLLAGDVDEDTSENVAPSPFYDVGSWFFHGTGFTASPFVWTRITVGSPGSNTQYILRGNLAPDGTVPTFPLAGVALLALGVAAASGAFLRRR